MIYIKLNYDNFEYDIYSLVKAFFPREDITFVREKPEDNLSYFLVINYIDDAIELELYKPAETNQSNKTHDNNEKPNEAIRLNDFELIKKDSIETDHADRKETKNRLKRLIYYAFSEETNKTLPWGTLSGIRPTKIPLRMIEEGKSNEQISDYMRKTYLASEEKIDISIDIARHEYDLIKDVNCDTDYSLYIGIPFCPSTCLYCSFPSYAYGIWRDRVDDYLEALKKEIDFISTNLSDKSLTTIYIGGGTPTSLSEEHLDKLLNIIEDAFPIDKLREYTIEAGRPDSINREKLEVIRKHNIDRISINPQTMNEKTLKLIGRHHSVGNVISSMKLAREVGFNNINMDIIIGLPGEDINDLSHTLSEIKKLNPDSLTVHSLAIKRSARLNIERDEYDDYIMENSSFHMDKARQVASSLDMKPYYLYRQKNMAGNQENIGFSKKGKEGLYNILIMEEKQTIIALGAGSASKYVTDKGLTVTRSENVKDPGLYIDRIDEMIDRKIEKLEEMGWLTN